MKQDFKNILKISSVYTGTVLGAGFASGQEIKQFFVSYGPSSIYGILLSAILFSLIGVIVLNKIYTYKIHSYDEYMIPLLGRKAGRFIEFLVSFFMLSGFCVMVAGSGAIFHEEFGFDNEVGIFVMVISCLVVFMFDAKGLVAINTILTPIMLIGIVVLGGHILIFKDMNVISIGGIARQIAYNWFSSSLVYVSYNTLTLLVIMTALHPLLTKRRIAVIGGLAGGLALGIIALILWGVLIMFYSEILSYEIPFLHIVMKKGKLMELIYIFILYCAMFTTAVSNGFGFLNRILNWIRINRIICIFLFCGISIPLARIGFSNMVKNIYSLFGYLGMFMMVVILLDGIKEITKIYKEKNER